MRKKVFFGFTLFVSLALLFTGCPDATKEDDVPLTGIVNTVWAGETPRAGDWLTITFKAENKIILSFAIDNTSNEWGFTYDSGAKKGTIATGGSWSPAPEGFTISADAKTLTVPNYGGHGGAREFKRLRQGDLTLDNNPFSPGDLPANLVNTVWAGETPRAGDWLTITFKDKDKIVLSFAIDNTSNEWSFTYGSGAKKGTITTGTPWSPAPDGFTISADAKTLTVPNYGGHGEAKEFARFR